MALGTPKSPRVTKHYNILIKIRTTLSRYDGYGHTPLENTDYTNN